MVPDWYEPEPKPKKRKASTTLIKDLERMKKKAAPAAIDEDDMMGVTTPTGR